MDGVGHGLQRRGVWHGSANNECFWFGGDLHGADQRAESGNGDVDGDVG